jgi:hypothetical protein
MTDRRCGTCALWRKVPGLHATLGYCNWPLPAQSPSSLHKWPMLGSNGHDCPTWTDARPQVEESER